MNLTCVQRRLAHVRQQDVAVLDLPRAVHLYPNAVPRVTQGVVGLARPRVPIRVGQRCKGMGNVQNFCGNQVVPHITSCWPKLCHLVWVKAFWNGPCAKRLYQAHTLQGIKTLKDGTATRRWQFKKNDRTLGCRAHYWPKYILGINSGSYVRLAMRNLHPSRDQTDQSIHCLSCNKEDLEFNSFPWPTTCSKNKVHLFNCFPVSHQ